MLHFSSNGHDVHHDKLVRNAPATVAQARNDGKYHLLLAASGSVATIKLVQIINGLAKHKKLSIRLILTKSAVHFLAGQSREQPTVSSVGSLPNVDAVYTDASEWAQPWKRGAPILHIELRKWADVLFITPLSANSMAKMVNGICDNLLGSVIRAWDVTGTVDGAGKKKIVCAIAMNTAMYRHPVTAKQLRTLQEEWGGENGWVELLEPIEKELACGDVGEGAMIGWEKIVEAIEAKMGRAMDQYSSSNTASRHLDPSSSARVGDPSSSLRARLRSQDVSAPSTASPKPSAYPDVYQQFQASLCTGTNSVTMKNVQGSVERCDAVTQLRESFAKTGMSLHASAMAKLVKAHDDVQSRIDHFSADSSTTMSQCTAIYKNIAYPLSRTMCHTDNLPKETIAAHLSSLKQDIISTKEEIQKLGAEWDACGRDEEDAWKELGGEGKTQKQKTNEVDAEAAKMTLELTAEAERIVSEKCQTLADIEKVYKANVQKETLKIMQSIMED
ncbi:hypothetical protein G7046_g2341 [Stylonectria norvegica]|nr:hypothetical protein G7046_g2341 [Stylonectria norvegica]